MNFLAWILLLVLAGWVAIGLFSLWAASGVPILRAGAPLEAPPRYPRVSILLAARNEEETLSGTIESLLNLNYPDFDVVLVDDDSSDRTGMIADSYAQRPEAAGKLRVIHNHHLPPGWRGKVHAMSLAEQVATGEWILATDADVVFDPSLLRRAVTLAFRKEVHLLSLTPQLEMQSQAERVVMPAFGLLLFLLFPPRLVNRLGSARALAAGAFILMRRSDLKELGGYARLRDTLVEDLRMAELFKSNGRRILLAVTRGLFRTRMYKSWREVFEGLSRSAFEGSGYSLRNILGGIVAANSLTVLPWVAAATLLLTHRYQVGSLAHNSAFLGALAASLAGVVIYLPVVIFAGISPLYALTLPFACLFYSAVSVVSARSSCGGPGLRWKGRHYQSTAP